MKLTDEILKRTSTITKNEVVPWTRDLVGDIFVANLDSYYGEGHYSAAQQLHRGGSGSGSEISKTGQQLRCHDYFNDSGDTLSRYHVIGLLRYPLVFRYFKNPMESYTIERMVQAVEFLTAEEYKCPADWNTLTKDFKDALENIPYARLNAEELEVLADLKYRLSSDITSYFADIEHLLESDILSKSMDISTIEPRLISRAAGIRIQRQISNQNYNFDITKQKAALLSTRLSYSDRFGSTSFRNFVKVEEDKEVDIYDDYNMKELWELVENSKGSNRSYPKNLSNPEVYAFILTEGAVNAKREVNFQDVEAYYHLYVKEYGEDTPYIKILGELVKRQVSRSSHYVSGLGTRLTSELQKDYDIVDSKYEVKLNERLALINLIVEFEKISPMYEKVYINMPRNEVPATLTYLKNQIDAKLNPNHTKLCEIVLSRINRQMEDPKTKYIYISLRDIIEEL